MSTEEQRCEVCGRPKMASWRERTRKDAECGAHLSIGEISQSIWEDQQLEHWRLGYTREHERAEAMEKQLAEKDETCANLMEDGAEATRRVAELEKQLATHSGCTCADTSPEYCPICADRIQDLERQLADKEAAGLEYCAKTDPLIGCDAFQHGGEDATPCTHAINCAVRSPAFLPAMWSNLDAKSCTCGLAAVIRGCGR